MIDYQCPKCKSDCLVVSANVEIDFNDRVFVEDADSIVEDVMDGNGDITCADCNHLFPIDDALTSDDEDDDEDGE